VAHFVGFPRDFNGNLQRALYEAIHVARLGAKVHFVVSKEVIQKNILARSIPKEYAASINLEIHPLRPFVPAGSFGWRINNLIALPANAMKLILESNNIVMHVHAPTPVTKPFSLSLIKKLTNAPMLVDLHDPWSGRPFSKSPMQLLQTGIMRYVIDNADFVVAAHTALVGLVKRINADKPVDLVPNGVDTEVFAPRPKCEPLLKEMSLDFDDRIVMFSGHLTEEKGLDTLIRAAKITSKWHSNIKFIVVGDGPIRSKIMSIVKSFGLGHWFRFAGFVEADILNDYLSLADLCVCPYKSMVHYDVMQIETPMKVVQYFSMGKPVIMSRVSEENVVKWSGGGLLIDPDNPRVLADAIVDLMRDEKSRKEMGEKGRSYVLQNLGWNHIAKRIMKIYDSLRDCR